MKIIPIFMAITFFIGTRASPIAKVIIVPADSLMETELVEQFKNEGYSEVSLQRGEAESRSGHLHTVFRYKLKTENPIHAVYIIPPRHFYLNGTVVDYEEGLDFTIRCSRRSVTFVSNRVGYFHVSIVTRVKGVKEDNRGRRSGIAQENMIMSAGMTSSCDNVCTETCTDEGYLTRDVIDCPPNNDCNIISHDASIYSGSSGTLEQPIGNATVVKTCDEFINAVCDKFTANGGKVDVYLDAHGNNGIFVIGEHNGTKEYVTKGSDCYNKICAQLKNKITTLTLFSCSTAGGSSGPTFIQCLANCLNANVKAWKKTLYVTSEWNSDNVTSIEWSTARNYTEPCKATPSPSPSVTPSTPTPSPTPTPPVTPATDIA